MEFAGAHAGMIRPDLSVIVSASGFYDSLFADIVAARKSVHMEMYCIEEGAIAAKLNDLLVDKAQKGLDVRLVYDSVGSFGVSNGYFDKMASAGVKIHEYHPVNPRKIKDVFSLRKLFHRNHRKLVLIDACVYYIGGMNIGERFLDWKDVMIRGAGSESDDVIKSLCRILDRTVKRGAFKHGLLEKRQKPAAKKSASHPGVIQVCDCRPKWQNYPAKRLYISSIKKAATRVWIAQAYFLPRRKLVKALVRAAKKGVDERVMIPDKSDVRLVDMASWPVLGKLINNGVKVERFTQAMMHAKIAIIDDHWVTVGTVNLDSMSLYWNLETNMIIRDPHIVSLFADIFLEYEAECRIIGKLEPDRLPLRLKILARLFYYYSWIL